MQTAQVEQHPSRDWVLIVASAAVLLYAAAAGFRTLASTDLFWTLRDGRYLVETGSIARQDTFSYTAAGRPWMYPQLAGLILYSLYAIGGYAALTWLCSAVCAGTAAALLAIRWSLLSCALTGLAIPLIAWRASVRADMFTTLLFAVFLLILLRGTAERHPWLPPLLMVLWVNLHPGFAAGLMLVGLFVAERILQRGPIARLIAMAAASAAATLINPFGWRVWRMFRLQAEGSHLYQKVVTDWQPPNWTWWRLADVFEFRDPESSYWTLLFIAGPALVIALWQRRWAMAALLGVAASASVSAIRFQLLLAAAVAAVVPLLAGTRPVSHRLRLAIAFTVLLLVGLRIFDLATNRYYFTHPRWASFGAGLSYVYPRRAVEFIKRERPPGHMFHEFGMGAFLNWSLGNGYPVFVDTRTIPFGHEMVQQQITMLDLPPASPEWRPFMDRWNINMIVIGLERHENFGPVLRGYCGSTELRLVYLDEIAAVFLRNLPSNREWLDRLGKQCDDVRLPGPHDQTPSYVYYAQAAEVYHQLGRFDEAWAAAQTAFQIFDGDASLHLDAAQIIVSRDAGAARKQIARALALQPSGRAWFLLGLLEESSGRYRDAIRAFSRVARFESEPQEAWMHIGRCSLLLNEPREALRWYQKVTASSNASNVQAYTGQARAKAALRDFGGAESDLRRAIENSSNEWEPYLVLAEVHAAQNRFDEARALLDRATSLGASGPEWQQLQQRLQRQ